MMCLLFSPVAFFCCPTVSGSFPHSRMCLMLLRAPGIRSTLEVERGRQWRPGRCVLPAQCQEAQSLGTAQADLSALLPRLGSTASPASAGPGECLLLCSSEWEKGTAWSCSQVTTKLVTGSSPPHCGYSIPAADFKVAFQFEVRNLCPHLQ